TPVTATLTLFNAANPNGVAVATGLVCGGSACTVTIPDAVVSGGANNGYFRLTTSVRDVSFGATTNSTAPSVIFYLDDETAPSVAGVTASSTIVGGQPATFTADMSDNVELGDNMASVGYTTNCAAQGGTCYY